MRSAFSTRFTTTGSRLSPALLGANLFRIGLLLIGFALLLGLAAPLAGSVFSNSNEFTGSAEQEIDRQAEGLSQSGFPNTAAAERLVKSTFRAAGVSDTLAIFSEPYLRRIVKAEVLFQNGARLGIQEERIAEAEDHIADYFGAPAWAHTYKAEVHRLRMRLKPRLPHLIGMKSSSRRLQATTRLSSSMAPSEAVYVFLSLIIQKVYSGPFQLTLQEFLAAQKAPAPSPSHLPTVNLRRNEILSLVSSKTAEVGPWALLQQAHLCLDLLQIDR